MNREHAKQVLANMRSDGTYLWNHVCVWKYDVQFYDRRT